MNKVLQNKKKTGSQNPLDQSDNIYVATFYPQKIYKLNSAGNNVQEYSLPDKAREVDVDGAGNVYVSLGQFTQSTIVKYNSAGTLIQNYAGFPGNILDFAVNNEGEIYAVFENANYSFNAVDNANYLIKFTNIYK
jgi:hypothetical protein